MKFPSTLLFLATFVVIFLSPGCKKTGHLPDYSAKMGGARVWTGATTSFGPFDTAQVITPVPDTVSTVRTFGGTYIIAWDNTLYFKKIDSAAGTVLYSYESGYGSTMDITITLVYYYWHDSMVYSYSSYHHQYGGSALLHTK